MQRISMAVAWPLLALLAAGCGGSDTGEVAGDPPRKSATTQTVGPDQVVFDFLEAVRTADVEKAAAMLTATAREKTAEQDMMIAPQGSDTARFEVTNVDLTIGEGAAHVGCMWTDVDEEGFEHTDNIVWILREEPEGWRIAGMAAKVFEDQPPLFLNFEDAEDMIRKEELVKQEMMRRAEQQNLQSRQPDAPGDPSLR